MSNFVQKFGPLNKNGVIVINPRFVFSGYRFPWVPFFNGAPKFHDDHHRLFKYNYGTVGIMDYIHGTLAPA